jgi:hypothetical protein
MTLNQKIENHAKTKLRFLIDPETVSKDKSYKLGEWLHGEYRDDKLRKAAKRTERVNNSATCHEETDKRQKTKQILPERKPIFNPSTPFITTSNTIGVVRDA